MAVGGIEIGVFEMGRRRQYDIAVSHALGHRQLDADSEYIVAGEAAAHAVLVRVHDDGIVVVRDE